MASDLNERQQEVDEDMEEVVTMVDVLQEEQDLEEDTKAVLGASDAQNCTYNKGYVKRQALYACMTCIPQTEEDDLGQLAGVCLACSYKCHEGHTLIELYTKRNFRCDCGNSKFGSKKCSFIDEKDECNENNVYNQNFVGLYCICKRPYPDPESNVSDEMIQCTICEDWYHFRHLETNEKTVPENYGEMVCQCCMDKYQFLKQYSSMIIGYENKKVQDENVEVEKVEEHEKDCKLPNGKIEENFAAFMVSNWRQQLCRCAGCIEMYEVHGVEFIIDEEDSVQFYEEKGKASQMTSQYEAGMEALSSLERVQQVEAIAEYNDMKNHLKEYLQKFVDNKKIVREEDIREFFSSMSARKRQRVDLPSFCR
ncbi:putative E3 ubiquitin-protein ligase UBR7 [Chrysoperla carnea]|uniref:putative E3 ubiquitin-protein ligase UBR7 n=1 Tax=Chrysoperla carnea TaxID=189513 RepID=UPI001D0790EC|nr:putative E3 ubiquitin-protein ligase UBR7 [Chrysoperla carnea]